MNGDLLFRQSSMLYISMTVNLCRQKAHDLHEIWSKVMQYCTEGEPVSPWRCKIGDFHSPIVLCNFFAPHEQGLTRIWLPPQHGTWYGARLEKKKKEKRKEFNGRRELTLIGLTGWSVSFDVRWCPTQLSVYHDCNLHKTQTASCYPPSLPSAPKDTDTQTVMGSWAMVAKGPICHILLGCRAPSIHHSQPPPCSFTTRMCGFQYRKGSSVCIVSEVVFHRDHQLIG